MKIYIVVQYAGEASRIIDVHATEEGAQVQARRILDKNVNPIDDITTVHILKKSVKGLKGIKFEIKGKERYLLGVIKDTKPKPRKMSQNRYIPGEK